jgi:hypothetical protein
MNRILQSASVMLAALVLLAPNALAQRPDDRAGPIGVGAVTYADSSIRPDDRPEPRGPGSIPIVLVTSQPATDRFDWRDAGMGAVGALALALVLAGGLGLATRARRGHATA